MPGPGRGGRTEKLRELRKLQIENLKNDLGVYSSFSLSPGSYPSPNVLYVEGTPSRFWLTIDHPALAVFNTLINVLYSLVFRSPDIFVIPEAAEEAETELQRGRLGSGLSHENAHRRSFSLSVWFLQGI